MATNIGIKAKNEFHFANNYIYLNHGAYGAVPKMVQMERLRLLQEQEEAPDAWYRWTSAVKWRQSLQCVANFMNCKEENLTFVANTTTGCNAVLKSLPFENGDSVLVYNYTYPSVRNTCEAAVKKIGGAVIEVIVPLATPTKDDLIQLYRDALERYPRIKLVLLDWISGPSAMAFPVKELIGLCRQFNKLVLVDGAHAPGQMPNEVEALGTDFFVGNLHKWMFTARGCAVLWVHPKHQGYVKPAITANNYDKCPWHEEFRTQGTIDNSIFFSVHKAVEYINSKGGLSQINKHCSALVSKAASELAGAWDTEFLPVCAELQAPHMRLVRVPLVCTAPNVIHEKCIAHMPTVVKTLSARFNISVSGLHLEGQNWIRLSASVHNCIEDYMKLRDAIFDLKNNNSCNDIHT